MEKTKPNTTKAAFANKRNVQQRKINTKKLKPGLVAFYDNQAGNGAGLFSKEKISKGRDKKGNTHTHTQPFNGLLSGTTRVGPLPEET